MFLLDTNVLSELRRPDRATPSVVNWALSIGKSQQHISVITLMELELGALSIARRDPRQGKVLRHWISDMILPGFLGRVVPFGEAAALRCASLHVPDRRPERDAMIAATALEHQYTLVTRNVSDFALMGVTIFNPWQA